MNKADAQIGVEPLRIALPLWERVRGATGVAAAFWVAALAGLVIALYHRTLYGLAVQWYLDPNYSHGFLVPLLSTYFVWERREQVQRLPIVPNVWGVVVLGIGLLMLLVGSVGAELFLQRTSLIVVIAGVVLLVLGRDYVSALAFPIAFLIFMVPLPAIVLNTIAFPLQLLAAKTATFCLFNLGIPVAQ